MLEHLLDPLAILKRHVSVLKTGGKIIISVPKFRHYYVLYNLFIRGYVKYKDRGILDRTHVRLTTSKMVKGWLKAINCNISCCEYRIGGLLRDKIFSNLLFGFADEFLAVNVIVVGQKANQSS